MMTPMMAPLKTFLDRMVTADADPQRGRVLDGRLRAQPARLEPPAEPVGDRHRQVRPARHDRPRERRRRGAGWQRPGRQRFGPTSPRPRRRLRLRSARTRTSSCSEVPSWGPRARGVPHEPGAPLLEQREHDEEAAEDDETGEREEQEPGRPPDGRAGLLPRLARLIGRLSAERARCAPWRRRSARMPAGAAWWGAARGPAPAAGRTARARASRARRA